MKKTDNIKIEEIGIIEKINNFLEKHHTLRKLGKNAVIMCVSFIVCNQVGLKNLLPEEYEIITLPLFYLFISALENYLKHNPPEFFIKKEKVKGK